MKTQLFVEDKYFYKILISILLLLYPLVNIRAQVIDLKQDIISFVRYGDEVAANKVADNFTNLINHRDTIELRKVLTLLQSEKLYANQDDIAIIYFLDTYIAMTYMSLNEHSKALSVLGSCYDFISSQRVNDVAELKIKRSCLRPIVQLLAISYNEHGDYKNGYKYSKLHLNLSKGTDDTYFSHSLLANSEYGLGNIGSAYKHIRISYENPSKEVALCVTYIDILNALVEKEISAGKIEKAHYYYKEKLQVIKENSQFDLSIHGSDNYLIDFVEKISASSQNFDRDLTIVEDVINSKVSFYKSHPENVHVDCKGHNDFKANIAQLLGALSLEEHKLHAAETFFEYAYNIYQSGHLSASFASHILEWYAHYRTVAKKDYKYIFDFYENSINHSIVSNDLTMMKESFHTLLSYFDQATWGLRGLYNKENRADGIYLIPTVEIKALLVKWKDIITQVAHAKGEECLAEILTSYRDVDVTQRDFAFYSFADIDLLLLYSNLYDGKYLDFEKNLNKLCLDYHLTEEQVSNLLWRISNKLFLHNDISTFRKYIEYLGNISLVKNKINLYDWALDTESYTNHWIQHHISSAKTLVDNGEFDKGLQYFNDILEQIKLNFGINNTYIALLNEKSSVAYENKEYNLAKESYELADSLWSYVIQKDLDIRNNTLGGLEMTYSVLGEHQKVLNLYSEVFKCLTKLSEVRPDFNFNESLGISYYWQGRSSWMLGNHIQGENLLQKSYDLIDDEVIKAVPVYELLRLYKTQVLDASTEDFDLIDNSFNKALKLAEASGSYSVAFCNEFLYDEEVCRKLINSYVLRDHDSFLKFIDSFCNIYQQAMHNQDLEGNVDHNKNAELWKQEFYYLMATDCRILAFYDEAVELFLMSINHCDDHQECSDMYSFISNIYSVEQIDYIKSLQYAIKASKELFVAHDPASDTVKSSVYNAFLCVKNNVASSTRYYLRHLHDEDHPHLEYEENSKLINIVMDYFQEIRLKYGCTYLQELATYFIEKCTNVQQGDGQEETSIRIFDEIDPYAQCLCEKILLDISFDFLDKYDEQVENLYKYLEENSDNYSVTIKIGITIEISNALLKNGHYEHSKNFLLSKIDWDNRESLECYSLNLAQNAIHMADWEFAFRILYSDAGLVHPSMIGFGYYKNYYDINNLVDQLLLLNRLLTEAGDSSAEEYLQIVEKLIEDECVGQNGKSIRKSSIATIYNNRGCNTKSIDEKIQYFKKANEAHSNNITIITNLAWSYLNVGQLEEAESLLTKSDQFIRQYYLDNQLKYSVYRTQLRYSLLRNAENEGRHLSRKIFINAVEDFKNCSKSMNSTTLANYWNENYANLLELITSADARFGEHAETSYDVALFQKGVLLRNQNYRKNNVLNSADTLLIELYHKYCYEQQHNTDSVAFFEKAFLYHYSMHPEFMRGNITPSWRDVQNSLGEQDVAIEFSMINDNVNDESYFVALLLTKTIKYPKLIRICKYNELINLLNTKKLKNGYTTLYDDFSDGVNVLYSMIWAPLETYLTGCKNIYFSPYDQLNFINIECLQKKEEGKRINQIYNIRRVSSTGILTDDKSDISNVILYGGIDYNCSEQYGNRNTFINNDSYIQNGKYSQLRGFKDNWSYLSNTVDEINYIGQEFEKNKKIVIKYTKAKATEESFKSISNDKADIIHLATHGYYYTPEAAKKLEYFTIDIENKKTPGMRSGVLFSGANIAWSGSSIPDGVEDGILNSDEIMGMNLSNTDLLVLSACQSGLGDLGNDGTYGIQRSFKIAGVKSIIMSLWEVDDEATRIMMTALYEKLAKGNTIKDSFDYAVETVRKAYAGRAKEQPKSIPRYKRYDSAYYWNSFILLD